MSSHRLRNAVIDLLLRIEKHGGFSHVLIDQQMKAQKLASKDEGLLTELVYGTLERKLTLDYYLEPFIKHKKVELWVRILLRMSLYQMLYLDKVPSYAVIYEAVEIAKQRGHKGIASFVNGVLRNIQRQGVRPISDIKDPIERLSIETSHPKWLVRRWVNHYGYELTREMCEANLTRKPLSVRIQSLRMTREEAIKYLKQEGYEVKVSPFSEQGMIIEKGNILQSRLFKDGLLTIQDQSSMLVAEMLDVKPGMTVLDTCSAPGGKATHIAEKMQDQGMVYAHDIHKKKINLIQEKANTLKLSIIRATQADARQLADLYADESFERILVDAPCSGLGVVRGKPDIKYHKEEEDIKRLAKIQMDILTSVAPLLKVNGLLIYSTCTVDPEENEGVVRKFLEKHPNYTVDPNFFESLPKICQNSPGITPFGLQLFPHLYDTDGFFLTRLIRYA